MIGEFDLIAKYFRPLSQSYAGSLNLRDDAALLDVPPGHQLVVTTDTLIAGVHFLGTEEARLIAKKALRVNLSDLSGMGAEPLSYFVALSLPANTPEEWVARFAAGLAEDQRLFGISLAGGDTTATPGPLTITITATGTVPHASALLRSHASASEDIYVSGTLGDAALGLLVMKNTLPPDAHLQDRYLLPRPRLALGLALRGIASACLDISDGVVQDLGHICAASHIGAVLEAERIPLSAAATPHASLMETILTGGDDYELLFTAQTAKQPEVEALANVLNLPLTRIGNTIPGSGVTVLKHGSPLPLIQGGYRHFA